MNLKRQKLIIALSLLFISASSLAALMDKTLLLETIGDATTSTLCADNYNKCFGVTAKACKSDVNAILVNQCSSGVPAELNSIAEVQAHSGTAASCLATAYIEKHKTAMKKNSKSPACQAVAK